VSEAKVLSIVVPVFNKYNFTSACLNDLFRLPDSHEIVVVDNGSSDGTSALAQIKRSNFKYIRNDGNEGFAKACNRGFAESIGDAVMFLNNDIRVQKDHETWTQPIIDFLNVFARDKDYMVGPTVGILNEQLNFVQETDRFEGNHWYMGGWNLTATRDSYEKLILPGDMGPFSTEFGLAYFEDTDMTFRARAQGFNFEIMKVPVTHFGKVTSTSIGLSGLYSPAQQIFKKKWLGI